MLRSSFTWLRSGIYVAIPQITASPGLILRFPWWSHLRVHVAKTTSSSLSYITNLAMLISHTYKSGSLTDVTSRVVD